jgi:hypothetical protein
MADWTTSPYYPTAIAAADAYGVPENIFTQLIGSESGFNPNPGPGGSPYAFANPSYGGGIAQFIPSTAASMGINRLDPTSSLYGAAQYLSQLYQKTGSWLSAVTSYKGIGNATNTALFGAAGSSLPANLSAAIANPSPVTGSTVMPASPTGTNATQSKPTSGPLAWLQALPGLAGRAGLVIVAVLLILGAMLIFARQSTN